MLLVTITLTLIVYLFHELRGHVEKSAEAARATTTTTGGTTSASLALQIELECHLSSLSNSILLRSSWVL